MFRIFIFFLCIVFSAASSSDLLAQQPSAEKKEILQGALTARYGITSRFQAELKIPYIYRWDREVMGGGTTGDVSERSVSDNGIGDIEGALFYHLLLAKRWIPAAI